MELPHAAEARKKVESGQSAAAQEQMALIIQAISKAINRSETSISMDGYLIASNKAILEEKGYKTDSYSKYNESSFGILW